MRVAVHDDFNSQLTAMDEAELHSDPEGYLFPDALDPEALSLNGKAFLLSSGWVPDQASCRGRVEDLGIALCAVASARVIPSAATSQGLLDDASVISDKLDSFGLLYAGTTATRICVAAGESLLTACHRFCRRTLVSTLPAPALARLLLTARSAQSKAFSRSPTGGTLAAAPFTLITTAGVAGLPAAHDESHLLEIRVDPQPSLALATTPGPQR